jgi:hypothetical protein
MTEISLDSPKDLQFLKSNISLAARKKLDIHLPSTAVPDVHSDTLRKRVEEMLDEVCYFKIFILILVCITDIRYDKRVSARKRDETFTVLTSRPTR